MVQEGYPIILFYLIAIFGITLSLFKPKAFFWFTIFYFAARGLREAALTRIPELGPYFNLDDLVLTLLIIAVIRKWFIQKISFPLIVPVIFATIFLGLLVTGLSHSIIYEVQREFKYALYLPIGFFLAFNFIKDDNDAEKFIKLLFLGSMIASIQYVVSVTLLENIFVYYYKQEIIRSVSFLSVAPYFLLWSVFLKEKDILKKNYQKIIYAAGLLLFIINLILSQTKSVYLMIIFTVIIIYIFYGKRVISFKKLSLMLLIPIAIIGAQFLFDFLDIRRLLLERFTDFFLASNDSTTYGRYLAAEYELKYFLESNLVLGNGLGFHFFISEGNDSYISWGHLGHISYLARLGILGFVVYSIYLPFKSLKYGNKLFSGEGSSTRRYFILFCITWIIGDWILFWMSSSYLSLTGILPGFMFGALWGYYNHIILKKKPVYDNSLVKQPSY